MRAQSRRGTDRNILVDFGYTPETLLNNNVLVAFEKADHPAEMIVVAVAQNKCVEVCRIDLQYRR